MKNFIPKIFAVTLIIAASLVLACKKKSDSPVNLDLKKSTEAELRNFLAGDWFPVYRQGGVINTLQSLKGDVMTFYPQDSVKWINFGVTKQLKGSWQTVTVGLGDQAKGLNFPNTAYFWVFDKVVNDTLQFFDYYPDGFRYFLIRKDPR